MTESQLPTWRDRKTVLAHVTLSRAGDEIDVGDEIGVLFHDRGFVCEVKDVETEEFNDE